MLISVPNKVHAHVHYAYALRMFTYIISGYPLKTSPKYGNKHY
jgi:hypothetical protein